MVFRAKTNHISILQSVIRLSSEFLEIGNLEFGEEGVYLQGMDSNNVALFEFLLDKTLFSEYEYHTDTVIGISLKNL